ncbi:MAG: NAD(P)/FAD-dependent oxidoreductase [Acidimicrobiia bacterium]
MSGHRDAPGPVLVVGAGPAGLVAAWHAARSGRTVTVLERAPVVGGLAGSFEVAGLRVDHGSHRLHPAADAALLAEVRDLLGEDLQVRPRHGRIALAGRWLGFPLRAADLLTGLPPGLALAMARDVATSPWRRPRADTFAEVVRAGLGPTVYRTFYGPYARKLWGVDGAALTGEVARRRIAARSPAAIAGKLRRARDPSGRTFLYPRRGFGQISEALADAAVGAGVDLRLGTGLARLSRRDGVWRARASDGSVGEFAEVWSTAPVAVLAGLVEGVPDEVLAAAARLAHRAVVLVYLVVDRPRWTEWDAHYLPGVDQLAARLSEPRNYRTSPDDPPGVTVLCAEVPCDRGDAVWEASPGLLAARLVDDLARLGLPPVRPVDVEVRRVPRVYPVWTPGAEADLAAVEGWVAGCPGLVTFGRQGLFVADNAHHVMAMGAALSAASAGPGGGVDGPAWSAAREGFRGFVVED